MGKKIDLSSTESAQLRDNTSAEVIAKTKKNDLDYLKSLGARALPDDPTSNQWDAKAIKKQLYKQAEIIFAWLKRLATAQLDLGNAIDVYLYNVSIGKETPKVYATLDAATVDFKAGKIQAGGLVFINDGTDLNCYYSSASGLVQIGESLKGVVNKVNTNITDISSLKGRATALETHVDTLQTEDDNRHHIVNDADGFVAQLLPKNDQESGGTSTEKLFNHQDAVETNSKLELINTSLLALMGIRSDERELIAKILSGDMTVGNATSADKAQRDSQGNFINVLDYAKTSTMEYDATTGVITLKLYNQAGSIIDTKTINLPSELVFTDQGYDAATHSLWFKPASGGANITIPLTDLIDTYTKSDTDTCVVTIDNHVISVSVKDGSISLAKMSSSLQTTINGWASAESARVLAEQSRAQAEAQRVVNENARLAAPHLVFDTDGYICINYGTGRDITID